MRQERIDHLVRFTLTSPDELASLDAERLLAQLVPSDIAVRLDLSVTTLIHSGELAALVDMHKELGKHGKEFAITGISEGNRKLLRMTRLDQVLVLA